MFSHKKISDAAQTTHPGIFDPSSVASIYDGSAAGYSQARWDLDLFNNDAQLDVLQQLVPPPNRVLDLGSGEGYIAHRLLGRGYDVVGVEISKEMIGLARLHVPTGNFIHASMLDVDFDAASFGLVVSFYALLHLSIADQATMFDRTFRFLKPGGYFYTTLMSPKLTGQESFAGGYNFAGTVYPYAHVPHDEYKKMLAKAGFTDVSIEWVKAGTEEMPWAMARKPL